MILTAVASAALVVLIGSSEVALPASSSGQPSTPFWRLLTVAAGSLPAMMMTSRLDDLEATAGGCFHRLRALLMTAVFALSCLCLVGATLLVGSADLVAPVLRAMLAWWGLALITGRLLGWRLSWAGPWLAVCAIIYWGFDPRAGTYRWWELTARPADDPAAWLTSVLLLALGVLATYLTPWRLHAARRRRDHPWRPAARRVR